MTHVEPMDPNEAFAELGRIKLADVNIDTLLDKIAHLAKRAIPGDQRAASGWPGMLEPPPLLPEAPPAVPEPSGSVTMSLSGIPAGRRSVSTWVSGAPSSCFTAGSMGSSPSRFPRFVVMPDAYPCGVSSCGEFSSSGASVCPDGQLLGDVANRQVSIDRVGHDNKSRKSRW
ncbi:hypothetical protein [Actinoplanes sp. NPDC026623]|uniref:hypothetical protein n=1 Tax=Actinoplanes sp. NPDC026623 TaxID=3155610 RepID=UPI0033C38694